MELRSLNPLIGSTWDELLRPHADATFFHTSAWARVLSKTYGHVPCYTAGSDRGQTVALLPMMEVRSRLTGRRGVSLPFTDACGPLVKSQTDCELITRPALRLARERGWKHVEIRGRLTLSSPATPALSFHGHKLDLLAGSAAVFARFESSVRRAIRKAERGNLKVQVLRSREAVLAYYDLHIRTRKRHGLPPQSRAFFQNIFSEIIEPGAGFVALATHDSVPVAGAVFFHFGKHAIYNFGASDEDKQELRGNNLVMWEAIRFLVDRGFKTLDFGRTSLNNDGLRRFKQSWGTKEETIEYFKFNTATQQWAIAHDRASGFHNAVFSRLPSALNRLAGAMIYPHLD